MRRRDEAALAERLARLSRAERDEIYEEARRRRRGAVKRDQDRRRRNTQRFDARGWDEDRQELGRAERAPASLQDWALKVLAERERAAAGESAPLPEAAGALREGRVLNVGSRLCTVRCADEDLACVVSAELAANQQTSLAVGDRVSVEVRPGGEALVTVVHPRRTRLSRPDPTRPGVERVLVANVDVVVIVASVASPPLRPRLIDRYLIAIERGGAQPVLAVNKVDLAEEDPEAAAALGELAPYEGLDLRVIRCSARTGQGMDALRQLLTGQVCALVGHSGVGKSSLINALCPALDLKVGETNEVVGRGRHTTTRSTLHQTPGGITVIDTPGVRSFGILPMEAAELRWYFPEFEEPARGCRFNDCSHVHEPGCQVLAAVERGEIPAARYGAYARILKSLDSPPGSPDQAAL